MSKITPRESAYVAGSLVTLCTTLVIGTLWANKRDRKRAEEVRRAVGFDENNPKSIRELRER